MKKIMHFLLTATISCANILSSSLPFQFNVSALSSSETIYGKLYEFDEKNDYEFSSSNSHSAINKSNAIGSVIVNGEIVSKTTKDYIQSFEVKDDTALSISFEYSSDLLDASDNEWYIVSDSKKKIDSVELDEKIGTGTIILQTSLDNEHWFVNTVRNDFIKSTGSVSSQINIATTNDIQLTNGCYYRVIVAYKLEKEIEADILDGNLGFNDCRKHAEVYSFYAGYKTKEETTDTNIQKYYFDDIVNTGKDNGYSGNNNIGDDDPHYGWKMGTFKISGFSDKTDDQIFLKNVGDKLELSFDMLQNVEKLNNNENLKIVEDKDGYDQYFQTAKTNMKHGALIIRYTDYQNVKHDPVIYTDYLAALTSPSADTKVKLFEEGDYEVALDYKIKDSSSLRNKENDYRLFFTFKVRNSNCMVFPFDTVTKSELTESSVTENGFYLDMARSRYLKINVTMARWTKNNDGHYVEDIRYSKSAKDGDKYTEDGIYTIEVKNPSTGKSIEKKIYVGTDSVLKASMNPENASYTIDQISQFVTDGATISDDGTIIMPVKNEESSEEESISEISSEPEVSETSEANISKAEKELVKQKSSAPIAAGGVGAVTIIGIAAVVLKKKKR
ncbi:hypothetical protein [Ruminococcus albus]|uniref:Uncharacterized protein n=1 Tax=Ruminococcus albus TaxID=1264 RepID=A0A1I1N5A1_RUMAL|nr:hypothetical protein [Ruminococcus albus]SFC90678.1 hypothetical protein SAMN02910406_02629 [Ruminococcus albus]